MSSDWLSPHSRPSGSLATHSLSFDTAADLPITGPGGVTLLLSNLGVRKRSDNSIHAGATLTLQADVQAEDLDRGFLELFIGSHTLIRIRVRNADGRRMRDCVLGVSADPASIERPLDRNGEAVFLLPPGKYSAYLVGTRVAGQRVSVPFTIESGVDDCGLLELGC